MSNEQLKKRISDIERKIDLLLSLNEMKIKDRFFEPNICIFCFEEMVDLNKEKRISKEWNDFDRKFPLEESNDGRLYECRNPQCVHYKRMKIQGFDF